MISIRRLSAWVPFITSVVGLATAIASFITSCQTRAWVDDLTNCRHEVVVDIDSPKDREQVPTEFFVSGTSTIHLNCRYVFVIVEDVLPTGRRWKIVDSPPLQNNGKWSARVRLDHVPVGTEVAIVAHVTANARAYKQGAILHIPPEHGMPSDFVAVTRSR